MVISKDVALLSLIVIVQQSSSFVFDWFCNVRIPAASIPLGKSRAFEKNWSNARFCGQFFLANAPIPFLSTMMVKCPSMRPIYKNISCHFLINITVSA